MKKILYMIALVWMGIGMMSCEKEIKDYDGEEGVYFFVQWGAEWGDTTKWANQSYTPVEFVNVLGDTYDVKVRVMITGRTKDYDRTFRMVVDKDTTTAVENLNYEPFEEMQVVKAGWNYSDVMIHLKRNESTAFVLFGACGTLNKKLYASFIFASFADWSAAMRLSIISSKSPFNTVSSLCRVSLILWSVTRPCGKL